MVARDVELIIVTDPSNMAWLTGYDGWSFYTHQAVLLGLEGEPVWWGRGMDALGAKRTVFMSHENIVGYDDTYVQNPDKHPMETLAVLIGARGWSSARTGVERDNYYFSAAAYQTLVEHLPHSACSALPGEMADATMTAIAMAMPPIAPRDEGRARPSVLQLRYHALRAGCTTPPRHPMRTTRSRRSTS